MKKGEDKKLREKFQAICDDYARGTPLDELLSKSEFEVIEFYRYLGSDVELEGEFDKAKALFASHQENNLATKLLTSFEKLITGYTEIEYIEEFVPQYENGKEVSRVVTKRTEKTKHFQPSAQLVQFGLEKLFPNKYSQPSKMLPDKPKTAVKQVFKIGNQIIDFS